MTAWLASFVATCAVELAVVRVVMRTADVRVVLAAQLATHPLVWLAIVIAPGSTLARLAVVELGATLVEAAIYTRWLGLPRWNAFALSAAANAASLIVLGLI
jgi:hypothetical protein